MANLRTVDDIKEDVLFRMSEPTDGTSDFDSRVIPLLNRAYRVIWTGGQEFDPEINEKWLWLLATTRTAIGLEPLYAEGTVAVTKGNTTVTLSSEPPQTFTSGWHFRVDDHPVIFRVSAHTLASLPFTLDLGYTGDTASAASYKLFKLEYPLATQILYLMGPMFVYQGGRNEIHGMDESAMHREWPLKDVQKGVPRNFAQIKQNPVVVRFSHYAGPSSDDSIRVDYNYIRIEPDLASGSSEPAIPIQYRSVLADTTLFYLLKEKQDSEAEAMGLQARQGLRAMAIDNRYRLSLFTRELGRIYPRPDNELREGPLRTEGGVIIG